MGSYRTIIPCPAGCGTPVRVTCRVHTEKNASGLNVVFTPDAWAHRCPGLELAERLQDGD